MTVSIEIASVDAFGAEEEAAVVAALRAALPDLDPNTTVAVVSVAFPVRGSASLSEVSEEEWRAREEVQDAFVRGVADALGVDVAQVKLQLPKTLKKAPKP